MKKVIALLLVVSLLFVMAGCGSEPASSAKPADPSDSAAPSAPSEPADTAEPADTPDAVVPGGAFDNYPRPVVKENLTVGFIHLSAIFDSMQRYINQLKLECEQRGWTYIDGEFEANSEYREVWQNLITQGCDVIICSIADNFNTYADLVEDARNAGIGVYCVDNCIIDGIIANASCQCGIAAMELLYTVGEDYDYDLGFGVMTSNGASVLLQKSGPVAGILTNDAYDNMNLLALEDGNSADAAAASDGYALAQAWMSRFGDDLDVIFAMFGNGGTAAAEAIIASGDTTGEDTFVMTFDDGPSVWTYIRNNTPLKYSYTHPYELYMHDICTTIDDLQVKGMNPGDEGCIIEESGTTYYYEGNVLTIDNVPQVGASIHSAYNYYDPADTDAWYTYPGYLVVTD